MAAACPTNEKDDDDYEQHSSRVMCRLSADLYLVGCSGGGLLTIRVWTDGRVGGEIKLTIERASVKGMRPRMGLKLRHRRQ